MIDLDGTVQYSPIVNLSLSSSSVTIWGQEARVHLGSPTQPVQLYLFNALGQMISTFKANTSQSIRLPVEYTGIYCLTWQEDNRLQSQKVWLRK